MLILVFFVFLVASLRPLCLDFFLNREGRKKILKQMLVDKKNPLKNFVY